MNWIVNYPNGQSIDIRWADVDDVLGRIVEFTGPISGAGARDKKMVESYAEATYLKYRSAREDFAATASSFKDWSKRRALQKETLALLEARTADGQIAGALLLRSAWTGDIVVDFVMANQAVTKAAVPPIPNVGTMLEAAALDVGFQNGAPLIWAETAAHSTNWWQTLLPSTEQFIRFDSVELSRQRIGEFLRKNGIEFNEYS
jgi:hypothetical protein